MARVFTFSPHLMVVKEILKGFRNYEQIFASRLIFFKRNFFCDYERQNYHYIFIRVYERLFLLLDVVSLSFRSEISWRNNVSVGYEYEITGNVVVVVHLEFNGTEQFRECKNCTSFNWSLQIFFLQ